MDLSGRTRIQRAQGLDEKDGKSLLDKILGTKKTATMVAVFFI
jgi:hypothetical protein